MQRTIESKTRLDKMSLRCSSSCVKGQNKGKFPFAFLCQIGFCCFVFTIELEHKGTSKGAGFSPLVRILSPSSGSELFQGFLSLVDKSLTGDNG